MDYAYRNGELYHARSHKYIKREWINGKWRYFYKEINEGGRYGSDLGNREIEGNAYNNWAEHEKNNIERRERRIHNLKSMQKSYGTNQRIETDIKGLEFSVNVGKRNYAALKQQSDRVEKANQHNKKVSTKVATSIERAKNWLSKISNIKINSFKKTS